MRFLLAMLFAIMVLPAQARETINIAWGFNIGSNQANTVRILIDELNRAQNRFQFQFAHRPGAGGTIAANAAAENPNNTLVAMSSSFIIRPLFERQEPTHNLDQFQPILVQGIGSPLVITSNKFTDMNQALNSKSLNIGVSGVGSISHLAANLLARPGVSINAVNFKSMTEAGVAAGGQHVDLAVTLLPDVQSLIDANKLTILAYTGNRNVAAAPNKQLSAMGISDARQVTANYAIFASRQMDAARFRELHALLRQANQAPSVIQSLAIDLLSPANMNMEQTQDWYRSERQFWQKNLDRLVR